MSDKKHDAIKKIKDQYSDVLDSERDGSLLYNGTQTSESYERLVARKNGEPSTLADADEIGIRYICLGNMYHPPQNEIKILYKEYNNKGVLK